MTRRALVLVLLAASLGCAPEPESVHPPPEVAASQLPEPPEPDYDSDNLLNVTYGAAVVSRTGELSLEASAAHAIDGSSSSAWTSPPGGASQSFVFSLLAPSRIGQIGVTTSKDAHQTPSRVTFEASSDGAEWTAVGSVAPEVVDKPQLVDVAPFTARFLRVSVVDPTDYYALIRSIHAIGEEIAPPDPPALSGCFTVNETPAHFVQQGARVTGSIGTDPPTLFDGGTDGRVARLMWLRGPMWGHAAITMTPDGGKLTGITFHEEISVQQLGAALFGTRCDEGPKAEGRGPGGEDPRPSALGPRPFLDTAGRWTLYGLAFTGDDRLMQEPSAGALDALAALVASSPSQRFRVVAHELREPTPAQNLSRTVARVEQIRAALRTRGVNLARVEFVAAGSDWKGPTISVALQRLMGSRIVVERNAAGAR